MTNTISFVYVAAYICKDALICCCDQQVRFAALIDRPAFTESPEQLDIIET